MSSVGDEIAVATQDSLDPLDPLDEVAVRSRWLAAAVDPVAGQVFFAPECHAAYAELGFAPSMGPIPDPAAAAVWGSVSIPDPAAYFCSRGSSLGQVPGTVIASALGVFNPAVVVPAVEHGWSLTDAPSIRAARNAGALAQLERVLGPEPDGLSRATELLERATADLRAEGRPLFAGLRAQSAPDHPLGRLWLTAEMLREYRGDAHTAAWTAAGVDAVELGLLTELYSGMPPRSYWRSKGWDDADFDPGEERLHERGLVVDGELTEHGRALRERIESATDAQCRPIVDALGEDLWELVAILREWGARIRAEAGYPPSSPQDAIVQGLPEPPPT